MMAMFAAAFSVCVPSLLSTLWIPYKILKKRMWRSRVNTKSVESMLSSVIDYERTETLTSTGTESCNLETPSACSPTSPNSPSSATTPNAKKKREEEIKDFLNDEAKFEILIDWVYREFSS